MTRVSEWDDRVSLINFDTQPRTTRAHEYVENVINLIEEYEQEKGLRARARRLKDLATFRAQVSAIASYMALKVIRHDYSTTLVQRSNRVLGAVSRYKQPFVTATVRTILDAMSGLELIDQELGFRHVFEEHSEATRLNPKLAMVGLVSDYGLTRDDFRRVKPPEVIILREDKKAWQAKGKSIDYADTELTHRLRQELTEINSWLAKADLAYLEAYPQGVDVQNTQLRRIFNGGSFDLGGRLYGGFWQGLSKDQRRSGLRINGERVVTLDYSSMATRLAYAKVGVEAPSGDLYDVQPYGPKYREGFKKLINASFFNDDMRQKPKDTSKLLPRKPVRDLLTMIRNKHRPISHLIGSHVGLELMKMESDILVELLRFLMTNGVVALPVHDAVLVPESALSQTKSAMESIPKSLIGFGLPVALD